MVSDKELNHVSPEDLQDRENTMGIPHYSST